MSSISKEESAIIEKMFSWCASRDDLPIIKQSITEVKNGKGLYVESAKCKGDLYSLKFVVADHTGLALKAAGELGMALYQLVKAKSERERMIKAGIVYGIWMYTPDICEHYEHAKLNGKKFPLKKGVRVGFFRSSYPRKMVGCSCFIKPVLPF